ncbi:MAG: hypothetical protein E7623_05350 [Ruminococcaceae bacterium]|nr:hypothetical protein [Oscillospiraceae bacterium]
MRKEKLMRAIGEIDEKYLKEAEGRKKSFSWKRFAAVAAVICLCIGTLSAILFMPRGTEPPAMDEYKDNEYYPIIKLLSDANYKAPMPGNYFGGLTNLDFILTSKDEAMLESDSALRGDGATNGGYFYSDKSGAQYVEVTDNQTEGVIESDIIKRSDRYVYYMSSEELLIYSVAKEDTDLVGAFRLDCIFDESRGDGERYFYVSEREMYLSPDCSTIILISPFMEKQRFENAEARSSSYILVSAIDVRDPANIKVGESTVIAGSYHSSRLTGGDLLLFTRYTVEADPDYSKPSTFIPQIDTGEGMECMEIDDIVYPESINSSIYTVICRFDADSLSLKDQSAFLSYNDSIYVSKGAVYLSRRFNFTEDSGSRKISKVCTEIGAVSYEGEGLEAMGTVTVDGYLKDQYSMDEYEGLLRVVTTTDFYSYETSVFGGNTETETSTSNGTSADLYVIDISEFEIIASVKQFAPLGETVRSVRFDKNSAYVCTAIQLTDPVFFFDLSDVNNITYKDTGNIDGFSSSLINFGGGFLLGVGVGDRSDIVKLEVYEEGEEGVISVDKFEFYNSYYSNDYKSYFIDREKSLFGFGVNGDYQLFCFDGYKLHKLLSVEMGRDPALMRAFAEDGYIYIFCDNIFAVRKIAA